MGLIIQKYVPPRQSGYINTQLSGVPLLLEIVTVKSRNFINRKTLDLYLGLADADPNIFQPIHHFPPDSNKVLPAQLIDIAQLAALVERAWGKAVQMEFVIDQHLNPVQVRDLSASMVSPMPEVLFPDKPAIHAGAAVGVGDIELPLLDPQGDNRDSTGAVILKSNYQFSLSEQWCHLPKTGAVIIEDNRITGTSGHIQILCAEKGLICIFSATDKGNDKMLHEKLMSLGSIRIVANGLEGRIYKTGIDKTGD